jgi:uncharacterized peroxidase-related enzyme
VTVNYRHAPGLSPRERALCDFAVALTTAPAERAAADLDGLRAHGLDDAAILEAIEVVAMFNSTNRLAAAMGLQPDPEYLAQY